jgi:hypothetical protein
MRASSCTGEEPVMSSGMLTTDPEPWPCLALRCASRDETELKGVNRAH